MIASTIMNTCQHKLPKKGISVMYDVSCRSKKDEKYLKVASVLGRSAVAHHLSMGRSVTIFEDGKIVKLSKDGSGAIVKR